MDDLTATAGIRLEILPDVAEAERLVARNSRAAVIDLRAGLLRADEPLLVPHARQPAADQPVRPRRRRAWREVGLTLLEGQDAAGHRQHHRSGRAGDAAPGVIPWMIGRAFERVGDDAFMAALAEQVERGEAVPPEVLRGTRPRRAEAPHRRSVRGQGVPRDARQEVRCLASRATIKGQVPKFQRADSARRSRTRNSWPASGRTSRSAR